jgi:tripartite-type tricarboxylate transporter receptor subunit TctC
MQNLQGGVAMKTALSLFMLGLLSLSPVSAAAEQPEDTASYPARPVKLIVPYSPGAAADVIGRIVAQELSERMHAQFYVENLPGASGTIGAGAAARASADGYTLLLMNVDFVVQPVVKSKVPYDPFKSFAPVATVAAAPETISVNPSLPAANMKELIALVKENPGKYSNATPGYGSTPHIAVERLKLTHGLDIVQVPFSGGGDAVASTLAGHTQIVHITLPLVAPYIKAGTLRGLAVADKTRSPELPDVPTLEEAGTPNHDVRYWTGLMAPAGTRSDIVGRLSHQIGKMVSHPELKERLAKLGFRPLAGTPEELGATIKNESAEWGRVARAANIKID